MRDNVHHESDVRVERGDKGRLRLDHLHTLVRKLSIDLWVLMNSGMIYSWLNL